MNVVLVGLSHKTAPIQLRERVAAQTSNLGQALARLRALEDVKEACILSTCNRLEMYVCGTSEPTVLRRQARLFLGEAAGLPLHELEAHLLQAEGSHAIHHLFRVAASLDSMVVGEPQILGQVKEAYRAAVSHGAVSAQLDRVFQRAFSVAKRARNETGIAENAVSMSFAAVELGRQIFEDLSGRDVLLVGAGKMGGLAAKHLKSQGVGRVRVASRSLATAGQLAEQVDGIASSLSDLPLLLSQADIVICSTAAPGFLIDKKMVSSVLRERRYRPLLFVDIAVPRDVDPKVGQLDNVFVYDVDDLHAVLESNREQRKHEAEAAERLVREELDRFLAWLEEQRVVPLIKAVRQHALDIAEEEVQRTLAGNHVDAKLEKRMRAMSQSIVNKLLHPVLTELKSAGQSGDAEGLAEFISRMFHVEAVLEPEESTSTSALPEGDEGADVVHLSKRR
ncbi:MAG: glutamyl-tRNA reductase [Myxococcota bacterium]